MKTETNAIQDSVINMADDSRATTTATGPGANLAAARQRLAHVLDSAKEACDRVQTRATAGAKAADQMVRDNPYPVIGAAFGLGALLGFLVRRRG